MTSIFGAPADTLLTTTRAVRRRLDLGRPVELEVVRECLDLATQAPNMSNIQQWRFLVINDPDQRHALAEIYRKGLVVYRGSSWAADQISTGDEDRDAAQRRVHSSIEYLAAHLHEVPVLVIPCLETWLYDCPDRFTQATMMGSILPAVWSFCLAARARGLGTVWTTLHLLFEREAAAILNIPYSDVRQVALIPVAHTLGTLFNPAPRARSNTVVSLNGYWRDPSDLARARRRGDTP